MNNSPARFLGWVIVGFWAVSPANTLLVPCASAAEVVGFFLQTRSDQAAGRSGAEAPYDNNVQLSSGPVSSSYVTEEGFGEVEAIANYGVMGLRVYRLSPMTPGVFGPPYAFSKAGAYWQDIVQIDSPGLDGEIGRVDVKFTISGTTDVSGTGAVEDIRYRFFYGAANDAYDATRGELVLGSSFLNTERVHQVAFRFGVPFSMAVTIEARVGMQGQFAGEAEVDMAHTQTWGGFVSVTDGNNVAVPFTTSSESGADYSQPIVVVPEANACVFIGLGCATLASWRRRRRN